MSSKIIRVTPIEKYFSIGWNLGRRCNYDCMYCPTSLHDSTSPHLDLEKLKSHWIKIVEKTQSKNVKYKISFTGGEVTSNKDFIPFLQWMRDNYNDRIGKILLSSNGSATYKHYVKLFQLIDNISFSLHSEHVNEQKFFDTIKKLHTNLPANKHLHVIIMDEEWNKDRIKLYCEILSSRNISHSVNTVDYSLQTRTYPILKGKLNLANT